MSVKTLRNQLLAAIAMVLVAALALGSSTFAWFSMNNRVTVTGMTVTTQVSNNLLIAETNAQNAYSTSLTQTRECLLEPSSTINGINYYWTSTTNVDGIGNAKTETYTAYAETTDWGSAHTAANKTAYDAAFNTNYGKTTPAANATDVAYGYIDYVFYLQATNVSSNNPANLNLTKLALTYNNGVVYDKAWRVAMIVQDAEAFVALDNAPAAANVVSIYTLPSAVNFTSTDYAVGDNSGTPTVMDLNYGTSVTAYNPTGLVKQVAANTTAYYKVTMRLWLEGEDKSCTNATYALLTDNYKLDLAFELSTDTPAVTCIEKYGKVAVDTVAVGSAVNAMVSGTSTPLYAYNTTSGITVWGNANTVGADTNFYEFSGTEGQNATLIAAQSALT